MRKWEQLEMWPGLFGGSDNSYLWSAYEGGTECGEFENGECVEGSDGGVVRGGEGAPELAE